MTRQWLADPALMCSRHLTGEHAEAHMFLAKMNKGYRLKGYTDQSEFFGAAYVYSRHNDLALYLPGHTTPMDLNGELISAYPSVPITEEHVNKSMSDLLKRCKDCRLKHAEFLRNLVKPTQKV